MNAVYFETLGCPKNLCDSEAAAASLRRAGFRVTNDPNEAAVIVVNTCGFIDDAKRESIAAILELAAHRRRGARLVVSGCLSARYGAELQKELPEIDALIGVNDYERLPEIAATLCAGAPPRRPSKTRPDDPDAPRSDAPRTDARTAYLKISEGCDNRCAYCVIPDIRGPLRSRPAPELVAEARALAERGVAELILVAQDLTAYGTDTAGRPLLTTLLNRLCRVDGLRRIRLMYAYEDRVTDELIEQMAREDKICKYIDMPVQHADDDILRAMGRRSSGGSIRDTVARLRKGVPGIHIRTTLITGFPGERAAQFETLLDFVKETRFDRLGVFAYSREAGTPAAAMKGQVREDVKQSRLERILRLQQGISRELNEAKIGRETEVLVEMAEPDGSFTGRTAYDAPEIDNGVIFTAPAEAAVKPGDFVTVRVDDAFDYDLTGRFTGFAPGLVARADAGRAT